MRKQFVETVTRVLQNHRNTVLFLGDIGVFGFRNAFEEFKGRVFNIGILEQSTISLAAGWAARGYIPIVHTIAPFMVERAFEQLKVDFGYHGLPGVFASIGGSYDYASLGCTHHCPADVALIENIPGFEIAVPGHKNELDKVLRRVMITRRPTYVRMSERSNTSDYNLGTTVVKSGQSDVSVVAVGPCLDMVLKAVDGLDVTVVYYNVLPGVEFVAPGTSTSRVLVVEPYYRSSLGQQMMDTGFPRKQSVSHMCVPKYFIKDYGGASDLDELIGFTPANLRRRLVALLTDEANERLHRS